MPLFVERYQAHQISFPAKPHREIVRDESCVSGLPPQKASYNVVVSRYRQIAIWIFFIALIAAGWKVGSSSRIQPYAFLNQTHPISKHLDKTGTWTYYSLSGEPKPIAETARKELIARGFVEDLGSKPWFRFTKGPDEVIVCNHDEIATMHDPVKGEFPFHMSIPGKLRGGSKNAWAVAFIHNGSKSKIDFWSFQVKRFILQW